MGHLGERVILHVDMDAFFAAIEQLDYPELRGKPVIVGAPADARGVVCTCSYEARKFGVRSAMPSRTAAKLCPQGIFVPVRGERYHEVSQQVRAIFDEFTPFVEPLSIDEAFLDVTGSGHLFGGPEGSARAVKARIHSVTGLTASVGLAPNKFLAKLASDMNKPNGLTIVPRDPAAIAAFLAPLPVSRLWGVGQKSAEQLQKRGWQRIGDLQRLRLSQLERVLGERHAAALLALARGEDQRPIVLDSEPKSVSNEHTFGVDCVDWLEVERSLIALAEKVSTRLRKGHYLCRTAQLKLRWEDFSTITRQRPLRPATQSSRVLVDAALELLAEARTGRPVRLVGFGAHALAPDDDATAAEYQPTLFDENGPEQDPTRDRRLDSALDRIRDQFGAKSIRRGG